ncbi:hypothetical protein H8A97_15485 [Bradyrhizobium sp. Arg62]|uniref:hypothetical protein n=1 Tax=Bradyrhizobium brasilense TaxID=1419277 RepID=UPI001E47CB7E|nr:hypothetical protein [Bradyrhizobium brasilense]MCC8946478.1 hypothetical protein [Bradyrhizobium brasilense]
MTTTHDHEIVDRNGRTVRRPNDILQDGDSIRTQMKFMDHGDPGLMAAMAAAQSARRIEQFDAKTAFPGMELDYKQAALLDAAKLTPNQMVLFKDHVTRKGFRQALDLAKRNVVSITQATYGYALADPQLQAQVDSLPPDQRKVFADAFHGHHDKQLTFDEAMALAKGSVPHAALHQPGFGVVDATAVTTSEQRRSERDARIIDAWKRPPPVIDQQLPQSHGTPQLPQSHDGRPGTLTHDELITRRDKRLEEAFKQ